MWTIALAGIAFAGPPDRFATCDEQAAWFEAQFRLRPTERPSLWWLEGGEECPFETELVGGQPPESRAIGCEDKNGRRYGRRTDFGDGGKVAVQSHWERNREDGVRTEWDPVSYEVFRLTPMRDGRIDGEVVEWLEDGGVLVSAHRRGERHGPTWRLDERGRLLMIEWWSDNVRHGRSCAWREAGDAMLSIDQVYQDGLPAQ